VIQSVLFFLLGFLCAGFLALIFAPALWRRAVNLTRRRIESSIPLTMSEIQAEKDAMRADFAMRVRRLEMKLKTLNDKSAGQAVELARRHEEIKELTDERDHAAGTVATLETRIAELEGEIGKGHAAVAELEQRLSAARQKIADQAEELEKIGRMYDDASFLASSRQIDLVARETEIEKLSNDLSVARGQSREADKKMRETMNENRQLRAAHEAERKKTADLERRLARMMSQLSDREEKLGRREKELAELRAQPASAMADTGSSVAREDAVLREEIQQLAAEVVAMSARLNSDDPAMEELLEAAAETAPKTDAPVSLAERIRALQQKSEAG
jgi:chromosome segregation ATPase